MSRCSLSSGQLIYGSIVSSFILLLASLAQSWPQLHGFTKPTSVSSVEAATMYRSRNYTKNTVRFLNSSKAENITNSQTGPIVRITPNEIHVTDPKHHEIIYRNGSQFFKDPHYYGNFGPKYSAFVTSSNEVHRKRRSAINPFFSRKMVLELEDIVHSKVDKFIKRLTEAFQRNESLDAHHGFSAISVDVAT